VALDVPAVLQTQRAEVIVGQLARQMAFKLVTKLGRTGADELILAGATYDPEARKRSLTIAAEVMAGARTPA